MNDDCPICEPGACKGYPHLWKRMREDPGRWRRVHDQVNGIAPPPPTPGDMALRAYAAEHGCGPCH